MSVQLSLLELQRQFARCLMDPELSADSLPIIDLGNTQNNKRLDVYRNNVFHSLLTALADLCPVFKRLTGDEFFNGTGIAYLKQHPPAQAAMVHFGSCFPAFLKGFEHTHEHAWLIDIARLELALHQSYHAADSTPVDTSTLAAIPAEDLAHMKVNLSPAVRLIHSAFPIYQIWLANQNEADNDETIDLDSGTNHLCIYRPEYDVLVNELDPGTYGFLSRLSEGSTLEEAIINTGTAVPGFAADKALAFCLDKKLIENIVEDA